VNLSSKNGGKTYGLEGKRSLVRGRVLGRGGVVRSAEKKGERSTGKGTTSDGERGLAVEGKKSFQKGPFTSLKGFRTGQEADLWRRSDFQLQQWGVFTQEG